MQAKEVVRRAIERQHPPRVPRHYCNRDFADSDTASCGYAPSADFTPATPGDTEWGIVWASLDHTMGQPLVHPLADETRIDAYRPPDPYAPGRLSHLPADLATMGDKFTRFCIGISGFNQTTFLRGFEAFLMDLYSEPAQAARVLDEAFHALDAS